MASNTTNFELVQTLYIAFYQRPADPDGLVFWANEVTTKGRDAVINEFATSPEATALYGAITNDNIVSVVNQIYQALFNRNAEPATTTDPALGTVAGENFYVTGFKAGKFTPGQIALNVFDGVQGGDASVLAKKVAYANEFTAQVDGRPFTDANFGLLTTTDAVTYSGNDDVTAARVALQAVTADTTVTPALVATDVQGTIANEGDTAFSLANGVVTAPAALTQIRATFVSAEVGNGNANNAAGALAVALQQEDNADALIAAELRTSDEGTTLTAKNGQTFDVRDVSGDQRGNMFTTVKLGTNANEAIEAAATATYINAGAGDDVIVGGAGADFLVGNGGNDQIFAGAGDSVIGGAGTDTVVVNGTRASYLVNDGTKAVTLTSQTGGTINLIKVAGVNSVENIRFSDATVTVEELIAPPALGQTYALTKGLDNIPGTGGNDTISGSVDATVGSELNTSSGIDMVNGAGGIDTFKISAVTALGTANLPTLSNVEIIEASGANSVTLDTSAITGVTNLNVIKAAGAVSATAAATTDVSIALKDAAAIATIAAAGGKDVAVTLTDAQSAVSVGVGAAADAAGNVTISATGAAVTNAAATNLGAIAVTGGKNISLTQVAGDASGLIAGGGAVTQVQGGVTVIGNAATTDVTVKQTAEVSAVNGVATVAAVRETASVKFAALTAGQTLTAAGLTFTAAKNLTAAEVATAFSNLINGTVPVAGDTQGSGIVANGVYTGAINGWTSGAASADTVVFTATAAGNIGTDLAFTGTGTATVTTTQGVAAAGTAARLGVTAGAVSVTDTNGTIKTITIDGVGAASASTTATTVLETLNLSNVAAGATVTVADSAAALALNLEKVGTTATAAVVSITTAPATLNIKSTGANNINLTSALTETLNVSGTGLLNAGTAALGALKSVKVTETAGLTLAAGTAATVTSIDTTGTTGTVTASINGQSATYTGGAGVDNVTLTTVAPTKAISTGAGNDKVTLASGTTAMGTNGSINAGDGTADTLSMVVADAVTASAGTTFATKVTGFERLELTGATGAQAVDTAALGNYNDVTIANAGGALATTLNNLTSGATIRLNDGTNIRTIAAIKNADTNLTDILNVIVTDGTPTGVTNNNGTVVAAEVETVNITTVDGTTETPTNLVADRQNLTLEATKATKIVVTGDTALTLTNTGNTKVAEIDGSALTATAGLTVQAAGNTATVIKGGAGADVLTASSTGMGNVAQVSKISFTDGASPAGMGVGDSITVAITGETLVTQAFTGGSFGATLTALTAQINNLGSVNATLTGTTIDITAAVAGTPYTVNTTFVPQAASSVTGTGYADGANNGVLDVDTVQFTDGSTALTTGDALTITLTPAVGAPVTYTQLYTTSFLATVAALAGQLTTAGYTVLNDGAGLLTITAKAGQGALGTAAAVTDGGSGTNATATPVEGTTNFAFDADTLTVTEVAPMGADDTIAVTVTNGVGTYTTALVPFNTDFATTMGDVVTAVNGLNSSGSFTATFSSGTLTVTDKVAGGSPISNISLSFVNAANNNVSSSFTTTTENLTVGAVADKLFGGAGDDTLVNNAGLAELSGEGGNDLFVISTAGLNVNSYNTIKDFQAGDLLQFSGATAFKSAKVDLGGTAVFQDKANAAINALAANEIGWFQDGNDTYVVMDKANTTAFVNGTDLIVKLTGLVDLSAASFNNTNDTIALV